MPATNKTPLYRDDEDELLGYIVNNGTSFEAQTIFGYRISLTTKRRDAENILREQGLTYLLGLWQYYDQDEQEWFPCVIKEAFEQKVIVNRTNTRGFEEPQKFKQIIIDFPTEENLIKNN